MQLKVNAEKVKQFREARCWSQQQLCELSGLSLRTIQRIEAKSVASQESIKCLSAVFEIQPMELFCEAQTDPNESSDIATRDKSTVHVTKIKNTLKRLNAALIALILIHLIAFYSVFSAYNSGTLDLETFRLVKNSLSILLIALSILFAILHSYFKKQIATDSSI